MPDVRVVDARARFREIYDAVNRRHGEPLPTERALRTLLDEPPGDGRPVVLGAARLPLHFFIIPGLVGDCLRGSLSPFSSARRQLERLGYRSSVLWVNGRAGVEHNAAQIDAALATLPADRRAVLIGYSKGAADALLALVEYPGVRARTAAAVSLAGAVGGSPLADGTPNLLIRLLSRLRLPGCPPGDGKSLISLRRDARRTWLADRVLPPQVRYFSLAGVPEPQQVSRILRHSYRRLARESPYNDSQLIYYDALIPDSELLGYVNADHWALTLPVAEAWPWSRPLVDRNGFPRQVLLEALIRYIEERLIRAATNRQSISKSDIENNN